MGTGIEGKLKTWNEERGFGFITPLNGGQDIFVHISNYPRRGGKPVIGERLSFEVSLEESGKKKAVNVQRLERGREGRRATPLVRRGNSFLGRIGGWVLISILLFLGYQTLASKFNKMPAVPVADTPALATETTENFSCDGRRYCSQMTSCAEATYFLRHCPNTKMDGDGDGVPCEMELCGH